MSKKLQNIKSSLIKSFSLMIAGIFGFLPLCSCSNVYIPPKLDFEIEFSGDLDEVIFVNKKATIGLDYVSLVRFNSKFTDIVSLKIIVFDHELTSDQYEYNHSTHQLKIYGQYITEPVLRIDVKVSKHEAIIEPQTKVQEATTHILNFEDPEVKTNVKFGAFEYVNPTIDPQLLKLEVCEIVPEGQTSTLGRIDSELVFDTSFNNSFFINLSFSGVDGLGVQGNIPPGRREFSIRIYKQVESRRVTLYYANEYFVDVGLQVVDTFAINQQSNIVVQDTESTDEEFISSLTWNQYVGGIPSGFSILNTPNDFTVNDLLITATLLGAGRTITLKPFGDDDSNTPLSSINFGLSGVEKLNDILSNQQIQLQMLYGSEILYTNSTNFLALFNQDITEPTEHTCNSFTTGYDEQSDRIKIKVSFGKNEDPFNIFHLPYTAQDLELIPHNSDSLIAVENSGKVEGCHAPTDQKFKIQMEYLAPNFQDGTVQNISFTLRSKNGEWERTYNNYQIHFDCDIHWEKKEEEWGTFGSYLGVDKETGHVIPIIDFPNITVCFPPLFLLRDFAVDVQEQPEKYEQKILGDNIKLHSVDIKDNSNISVSIQYDNIQLFTQNIIKSTHIDAHFSSYDVRPWPVSIREPHEVLIKPLGIYSEPADTNIYIKSSTVLKDGLVCAYCINKTQPTFINNLDELPVWAEINFLSQDSKFKPIMQSATFINIDEENMGLFIRFDESGLENIDEEYAEPITVSICFENGDNDIKIPFEKEYLLINKSKS